MKKIILPIALIIIWFVVFAIFRKNQEVVFFVSIFEFVVFISLIWVDLIDNTPKDYYENNDFP